MTHPDLQLRPLHPDDELSFHDAVEEFAKSDPGFEFAFHFDESIAFRQYVEQVNAWAEGKGLPEKFVPNTYLVGVEGEKIIGRVSLRHRLTPYLQNFGGHVGYGVVPSRRNRGYATKMLRLTLPIANSLGISRLLITADEDNIASQRVIEKNTGQLEDVVQVPGAAVRKKRYWVCS